LDEFRGFAPMFVQQMSVNFPNQNAAIFVTEPRRDCHEVNSGHDANGTEIMAQIVKTDPFKPSCFTRDL
jgi:hypothetical protein